MQFKDFTTMTGTKWISAVFVTLVTTSHGCSDNEIEINLNGEICKETNCVGVCTPTEQCCLEKCFGDDPVSEINASNCHENLPSPPTCEEYLQFTDCIAGLKNRSLEVCWRHIMYFVNSNALSGTDSFTLTICPCDYQTSRKEYGRCWLSQCANNTLCTDKRDTILNQNVCCINKSILPRQDDCERGEKFQGYLNVSTQEDCMELCEDGLCRVPDKTRLPACCKLNPVSLKSDSDESLHGGVVAVIVIIVIVLIVVGALVVLYTYRIKQDYDRRKQQASEMKNIELTGIQDMPENDQGWVEEESDQGDKYRKLSWNERLDSENQAPVKYTRSQTPDFTNLSRTPDFLSRVHSVDELRNGITPGGIVNAGFRDNESYDEEQSYETYRRRTDALARERKATGDSVQYVFDDGQGHSSEDDDQRS